LKSWGSFTQAFDCPDNLIKPAKLLATVEIQNKAVKQNECSNIGDEAETSSMNRNMSPSLVKMKLSR
jgi:hypothetical protein